MKNKGKNTVTENMGHVLDSVESILNDGTAKARILLVEDSKVNAMLLQQILSSAGFSNLEVAGNGLEGLEKLESFGPDIIILDIVMPQMDGLEFCRKVRRDEHYKRYRDIPILVQTALSNKEEKSRIFKVGATDYVVKPYDAEELVARVRVHLERQELFKDLQSSKERVAEELYQAQKMQAVLMPAASRIADLEGVFNVNIDSYARTSSEMGGDFWGAERISDNEFSIYIVDFSGHGVTAALNTFRLHTLMQIYENEKMDPGGYLTVLNRELQKLLPVEQFATVFYGLVNVAENRLYYATAAAPNPVIVHSGKGEHTLINASGIPLGVKKGHVYETQHTPFYPGDLVLLYSDALIETENAGGDFLLEADVIEIVKKAAAKEGNLARETRDSLVKEFSRECMDNIRDDLTISVYYRKK